MNVPDAAHCSGCGSLLGLEPAGESDYLACPRCSVHFEVFQGNSGRLRDCGRCGGQFVEHALLRELIERREVYGAVVPRIFPKKNPLNDPVKYLPCPECRAMMTRRNFGGASGVIVDVCGRHGIWFDAGELPTILSFVESGGLAAARRREREEAEKRRLAALPGVTSPVRAVGDRSELTSGEELVLSAAGALLDFLSTLVAER